MLTKRKLSNLCSLLGHDPQRTEQETTAELKEPSDPESREVVMRIVEVKCRECGRLLAFAPAGIVHDPKYDS